MPLRDHVPSPLSVRAAVALPVSAVRLAVTVVRSPVRSSMAHERSVVVEPLLSTAGGVNVHDVMFGGAL